MTILALGVNHQTAPVAVREKIAFSPDQIECMLAKLMKKALAAEAAILSTCHRTELYCYLPIPGADSAWVEWLCSERDVSAQVLQACCYSHWNEAAALHLMRVASGLDSMVLGETQIFGQIKRAFQLAHQASALGPELSRLFRRAFTVAKQVRTETKIGYSSVSLASIAVTLAESLFSRLSDTQALLIGAGETIELAARHLQRAQVRNLVVANRTLAKAQQLAQKYQGTAISLEEIPHALIYVDIVVSSTASPLPLLGKGMVEQAIKLRKRRPILMIDLAVPRDVESQVSELSDVYLYTTDDLQNVINENIRFRRDAADDAELIVHAGALAFAHDTKAREAAATLRAFREKTQKLKEQELERALRALALGADPEAAIRLFAHSLTNKWLHTPSVKLRRASADGRAELLQTVHELFDLNE